jgi:hypothetical protein
VHPPPFCVVEDLPVSSQVDRSCFEKPRPEMHFVGFNRPADCAARPRQLGDHGSAVPSEELCAVIRAFYFPGVFRALDPHQFQLPKFVGQEGHVTGADIFRFRAGDLVL